MSESEKNEPTMSEPSPEEQAPAAENAASMSKPRRNKVIFGVGAVLFALIFLFTGLIAGWFIGASTVDERARSLAWLVECVEDNYYREVDDEQLYDRLFSALELDKFCTYYNVEEYDRLIDESEGNNEGYGVSLIYEGDKVRLYRTVYNSPAELAGLEAGMYIYRYDDGGMKDATSDTFYNYLSSHNHVTLEAGFEGEEAKTFTLSRADYRAAYCEYRDSDGSFRFRGDDRLTLTEVGGGMSVLDGTTAYLRLTEFDGNASEEFKLCLQKMKERGRTNLVLDLRCNGGGYLTTLCEIAAHLVKNAEGKKPLIATARYRSGKETKYTAEGNDFYDYFTASSRIRVLADENTASASEALMGAMLDYGTITKDDVYLRVSTTGGEEVARTYGKGVMQSAFVAPDGRALRLTVAEIFWPNGNSIHDVGIRAEGDHAVNAELFASAEEFLRMI